MRWSQTWSQRSSRTTTIAAVAVAVAATALSGCAGSGSSGGDAPGTQGFTPPDVPMQKTVGKGEGEVSILAWPGYAEDGTQEMQPTEESA